VARPLPGAAASSSLRGGGGGGGEEDVYVPSALPTWLRAHDTFTGMFAESVDDLMAKRDVMVARPRAVERPPSTSWLGRNARLASARPDDDDKVVRGPHGVPAAWLKPSLRPKTAARRGSITELTPRTLGLSGSAASLLPNLLSRGADGSVAPQLPTGRLPASAAAHSATAAPGSPVGGSVAPAGAAAAPAAAGTSPASPTAPPTITPLALAAAGLTTPAVPPPPSPIANLAGMSRLGNRVASVLYTALGSSGVAPSAIASLARNTVTRVERDMAAAEHDDEMAQARAGGGAGGRKGGGSGSPGRGGSGAGAAGGGGKQRRASTADGTRRRRRSSLGGGPPGTGRSMAGGGGGGAGGRGEGDHGIRDALALLLGLTDEDIATSAGGEGDIHAVTWMPERGYVSSEDEEGDSGVIGDSSVPTTTRLRTMATRGRTARAAQAHLDYVAAERLMQRAFVLRARALGLEDAATMRAMGNLMRLYLAQGKREDAEQVRGHGCGGVGGWGGGSAVRTFPLPPPLPQPPTPLHRSGTPPWPT
jgi:hypothetical protein